MPTRLQPAPVEEAEEPGIASFGNPQPLDDLEAGQAVERLVHVAVDRDGDPSDPGRRPRPPLDVTRDGERRSGKGEVADDLEERPEISRGGSGIRRLGQGPILARMAEGD
jgi:hypothetical protein